MNFRFTAILFFVLIVLIGVLLVVTLVDDKPGADQVLLEQLAGQKAEEIDIVELQRTEPSAGKLVFARVGKDRWELREGQTGRLDAAAVSRLIEALLKLKPTLTKEVTDNPAAHGLDKPSFKVTLRTSNQRSGTLNVGDTTLGAEKALTFVATGERPDVPVAVKRSDIAPLFRDGSKDGKAWQIAKWTPDYRQRRMLGAEIFDIVAAAKSLKVKAGTHELAMSRSGSEWKFETPPGLGFVDIGGDPATRPDVITGLRSLATTITGLAASASNDFIEDPEPLEKYGLAANDPNLMRIELAPESGAPDVLLVGKKVEGATPVKYYAQVPGENVVVKVFGDRIDALTKTVSDPKVIQDRTLIKEIDAPRIDAVDSSASGSVAKLRKVPVGSLEEWVLYGGPTDPRKAGPALANLLTELSKPRIATEALAAPDAFFAPSELKAELKVWIDGFAKKPESKDGAIPAEPVLKGAANMTFLFGRTEGDSGYLRRILADGSRIDFKIPASLASQAAKKRTDYFDLRFPEFPVALARKLSFNRGAENYEVSRSENAEPDFPTGKWVFLQPASLKDKIADVDKIGGGQLGAGLLGTLATLNAASVVSEGASDTELKAWGLDPAMPKMKAIVALKDDKDNERTFHFGNETADKAYVYFKFPDKPTVYLVLRVTLDQFLTGDLKDPTPYRIDTKDVKKITATGWKKKTGTAATLELERAGDNWIAKSPAMEVNPQNVALLLTFLRAPKPVEVVGPKPDDQFLSDPKQVDDPLTISLKGEKGEIVRIVLGSECDSGQNYFAWVSSTGQVIKLPSGLFRQFKDGGIDFFKK